jgi:hypothetical protein
MRIKRSIFGSIAVSAMAVALTMGPAHGQAGKDEQPGKPASASDKRALAAEEAGRRASRFAASKGALGAYYDGSKDEHVVVVSRGSQTSAAEASRAVGAAVRIEQRDIAKEQVDRFQATVAGRAFHGDATKYSYASYFDVTTGKLVLDTNAPASVIESLSSEFAGAIDVRAGGVTEDFTRRADTSPFWGGSSVKSNGWTCTTGFVVKKSTGTRYLLTAGHCFEPGWNVYTSDGNLHVGSVVQKAPIASRDMELIGGKSYGRSIFVGGTNSSTGKIVEQAGDPVVNFVGYCRSGQTTGEQCGHKVTSVTANFCPTSGCKTNVIAYTTGGASAGGDSGAPFYINSGSNVQARGIHVGRNTSTGTMYAEKWSVIAATLGVSIVT